MLNNRYKYRIKDTFVFPFSPKGGFTNGLIESILTFVAIFAFILSSLCSGSQKKRTMCLERKNYNGVIRKRDS